MEEKHLKILFIASLAGFFVIIGLISWLRPVRFLDDYDFYIQLVTKTFETAAEILAVYVCWLLYSYLKESRFGKMTLLIYFAIVFITLDAVCTISERTVEEYASRNTVFYMLKSGKHYFAVFKGIFILMAFVELYRFTRAPKAVATLMHAYEKARAKMGEEDDWR